MDHLIPYLKTVLGFVGFDPIEVVSLEGTTMDEETFKTAEQQAQQSILHLFDTTFEETA